MATDPLDYPPEQAPDYLPIPVDPRRFVQIPASKLRIDGRTQRDMDDDRSHQIANEFDWERMEAPTVTGPDEDGMYDVTEGQHRVRAIKFRDEAVGTDTLVWCAVLPSKPEPEKAQLALDIAKGRKGHSAYELWMLRLRALHEHEVRASAALKLRGLRLGKTGSASTISAVATVRSIVHGGSHSPEYGADLLGRTVDVIAMAFPDHDPESSTSRWERDLLLAVAGVIHRNPDIDPARLAKSLNIRPARQWISLGRPNEQPAHFVIAGKLIDLYNRNLRRGRLVW